MTKRAWILSVVILAISTITIAVFSELNTCDGDERFPLWLYFVPLIAYPGIILIYIVASKQMVKDFYKVLDKYKFVIDKKYEWRDTIFCVDIEHCRIACNTLPYPLVDGFDIKDCQVWSSDNDGIIRSGAKKVFVNLLININLKSGETYAFTIFSVLITMDEYYDADATITDELVKKYPALEEIRSLHSDIQKICRR